MQVDRDWEKVDWEDEAEREDDDDAYSASSGAL